MSGAVDAISYGEDTSKVVSYVMPEERGAYVYAIVVDGVVRYVGKGRNGRMDQHVPIARNIAARRAAGHKVKGTLFYNKLAKALTNGSEVNAVVLSSGMTDDDAYALERSEITSRDDLWNSFSGGRGSTREDCLKAWADEDRRERHTATMAAFLARPEVRQRISDGTKRGLARPGVLEARRLSQTIANGRPEVRAKKSAAMKALWDDQNHVARYRASLTTEMRRKMSESAKRRGTSPKALAALRACSEKRRHMTPDELEQNRRRAQDACTPEVKSKISAAVKARWSDPVWREHHLRSRSEKRAAR